MKIYKISNNIKLEEVSEKIQELLGLYDEETGEFEGIDFHYSDWMINGNQYVLYGVPASLTSIIVYDDYEFIPSILGKEYQSCASIEECSDVILNILQMEDDSYYEEFTEMTMEETFQNNIKNMPRTEFWPHGGYILRDGTVLDFSQGSSVRSLDHRAILDGTTKGMQEFILRGNIRIIINPDMSYGGINMYREPTESQYSTLRKIVRDIDSVGGDMSLDLANDLDKRSDNIYYPQDSVSFRDLYPTEVLGRIVSYYSEDD